MKYLHVELPSLHLFYKGRNGQKIVSSVIRTNYSKPSLISVASIMSQLDFVEVDVVDMKIEDQSLIKPYKRFNYGFGEMIASRMGMNFQKVKKKIEETDILGLSINPTSWAQIALDFCHYAKKVNPQVKVIIGGTDAIFRSEYYLRSGVVDFIMLGEGEFSGPALLKALEFKEDFSEIKGLAFLQDNKIIRTGFIRNIDINKEPLPNLELFKKYFSDWTTPIEYWPINQLDLNSPIIFMFLTRGCNNACSYCTTPQKYGCLRFKSLDRIEKELALYKSYGFQILNIWDDSLSSLIKVGQREHLIEIIKLIKKYGFAFEFSQGMVIKDLWLEKENKPDYDLIEKVFSHEIVNGQWVGFYGEYFPFEFLQHEYPYVLNKKLMDFKKELKVLESVLKQGGKFFSYSCILGRPEDGKKEIAFARKRFLQIQEVIEKQGALGLPTPFIYSHFPGTKDWQKQLVEFVYSIVDYPELYQLNSVPYKNNNFLPEELFLAKKKLEEEIYSKRQYQDWIRSGRYQW